MNRCWGAGGMLLAVMAVMAPTGAGADDIRTWVDEDGGVHYGDRDTAPGHSEPVQLQEGTYLRLEPVPERQPVTVPQGSAPAQSAPAQAARPCTPVIQEVVDPTSGMHSKRDTGRCQEDEPLPNDSYPDYVWGDVPACAPGVVPRDGLPPCQHRPRPNPRPLPTPLPTPPKDTTDRVLNPRYIGDGIRK